MKIFQSKKFYWAVFIVTFLLSVFLSYYGIIKYRYQVPPGEDILVHLSIIEQLKSGMRDPSYPSGFHQLVIYLSSVFGYSYTKTILYLWPIFMVLSGLSLYLLTRSLFKDKVALIVYVLYVFLSMQPAIMANDGLMPNLLASFVVVPMALIVWILMWRSNKVSRVLWMSLFFLFFSFLVSYIHHLTTLVLAATIIVTLPFFLFFKKSEDKINKRMLIICLAGYVILIVGIYLAVEHLVYFEPAKRLINLVGSDGVDRRIGFRAYLSTINMYIFPLGLLSSIALLIVIINRLIKKQINDVDYGLFLVSAWLLIYFVGSRMQVLFEPNRLARDLAMPATLLAGYATYYIYIYLKLIKNARIVFIIIFIALFAYGFKEKYNYSTSYNKRVMFSDADFAAIDYIGKNPGPKYYVLDPTRFWSTYAKGETYSEKFTILSSDTDAIKALKTKNDCILVGYHKAGVWPPSLIDSTNLNKLKEMKETDSIYLVGDPNKVWYLLCSK